MAYVFLGTVVFCSVTVLCVIFASIGCITAVCHIRTGVSGLNSAVTSADHGIHGTLIAGL